MVYNRQYNTRNSTGRYNTSGQFVAAGAQAQQQGPQQQGPAQSQSQAQYQQQAQFQPPPPPPPQSQTQQFNQRNVNQQQQFSEQPANTEMKQEVDTEGTGEDSGSRPFWMKSKQGGMKKISNRERRRRQNNQLRRLITPKNALMVLNEMLPHDQLATTLQQFTVEPADSVNQYYKNPKSTFCADLTLDGVNYKGYGENKIMARNAAAEQAIRDLILRRMQKAVAQDADNAEKSSQSGETTPQKDEEVLPMIQLASYALHKLFSEWEYDGHKVPQLRVHTPSTSEMEVDGDAGDECASVASSSKKSKAKKPPKILPLNAAAMHPCMLLTYMRSNLEYRELAVDGPGAGSPTQFTMSVDVDGVTYIGKASNKKEARKAAARSACSAIFGVRFDDVASANVPLLAPAANNSANTSANTNTNASANFGAIVI